MDIFATYATDETKEVDGVWVELGDAKFLVARAGNREYVKLLSKLVEKNQRALDRKDTPAEKLSEQLMIEVIAKTILKDWDGVMNGGKKWPFSEGNAVAALQVKDFRREIVKLSEDFDAYRVSQEAETAKN